MVAGSTVIKSTSFSLASPSAGTSPVPLPVPVPRTEKQKRPSGKRSPDIEYAHERIRRETADCPYRTGIFNSEELMDMLMNSGEKKGLPDSRSQDNKAGSTVS